MKMVNGLGLGSRIGVCYWKLVIGILFVICNLSFVILVSGCGRVVEVTPQQEESNIKPFSIIVALPDKEIAVTDYVPWGDVHFKITTVVPAGTVDKETKINLLISENASIFDVSQNDPLAFGPAIIFKPANPADIILKNNIKLEINYSRSTSGIKPESLVFKQYSKENNSWQAVSVQTNNAATKIANIELSNLGTFRFFGKTEQ